MRSSVRMSDWMQLALLLIDREKSEELREVEKLNKYQRMEKVQ